jgi:hypothetical protein
VRLVGEARLRLWSMESASSSGGRWSIRAELERKAIMVQSGDVTQTTQEVSGNVGRLWCVRNSNHRCIKTKRAPR